MEEVFDWKGTLAAFKEQARVLERSVALRKAGNERLAAGEALLLDGADSLACVQRFLDDFFASGKWTLLFGAGVGAGVAGGDVEQRAGPAG